MDSPYWKIGQLAKQTGLTVRALRHYDQKGLVTPSKCSDSGHRLYTEADIAKLQQVLSLKQMGFGLEAIKALLESHDYEPKQVMRLQMEQLRRNIQTQEQLYARLQHIYKLLDKREHVSTEHFMKTIEVMNMNTNKYFSEEQLEYLKRRSELLGPDKIREVENEWPGLIASVREEMEKGTPIDDPEVVRLGKRWNELMNLFSGGNDEIIRAAERFHAENPNNGLQNGMDGELYKYISQAIARL